MSSTKKFLLIYFVAYIAIGVGIIVVFGPAGFTAEYNEKYKADHDQYLSIVKDADYKIWKERPELHEKPEGADFVAEYEARPEYIAESSRRARFDIAFDLFNVIMVVYLVVHFAKAPLTKLIDDQIAALREKIETAEKARKEAARRKQEAEATYAGIDQLEKDLEQERAEAIAADQAQLDAEAQEMREQIDQETEDRKREEEHLAALRVKAELVDEAIDAFAQRIKATPTPELDVKLLDRFVQQLEKPQ